MLIRFQPFILKLSWIYSWRKNTARRSTSMWSSAFSLKPPIHIASEGPFTTQDYLFFKPWHKLNALEESVWFSKTINLKHTLLFFLRNPYPCSIFHFYRFLAKHLIILVKQRKFLARNIFERVWVMHCPDSCPQISDLKFRVNASLPNVFRFVQCQI